MATEFRGKVCISTLRRISDLSYRAITLKICSYECICDFKVKFVRLRVFKQDFFYLKLQHLCCIFILVHLYLILES